MTQNCAICGTHYSTKWRGWCDSFIPWVCSSKCFRRMCAESLAYDESILSSGDPRISKFTQSDRNFRSNYEREFSEYLRRYKVPHQYEPYVFTLEDGSRYVPDFLLHGKVFIEVKGIWTSEGKKKFKAITKQFYGLPIVLVDREFLNMLKRTETKIVDIDAPLRKLRK